MSVPRFANPILLIPCRARSPSPRERASPWFPVLAVVAALALPSHGAAQQPIGGTVVDAQTLQPLVGAQIVVDGTSLGALAGANGAFLIEGVPGATATIRVLMIGYATWEETVNVGDRAIRVELRTEAISLDEIVVTGTAGGSQARAVGNAVSAVAMSEVIERRSPPKLQSMLTAEVPGLRLRSVGGEIGGGGSIKIRGTGSLVLSNEPVIFVDGVRVDNRDNVNSAAFVNSRGGPSRLNDLALADVERIEVIKGPAAATLYGTEASNGVIQIFTKRGQQGAPRFEVSMRQGAAFLYDAANKYPVVWGVDSDTGQLLSANLVDLERERGTPIFRTGLPTSVFASVSGGIQNLRYYFSADVLRDQGMVDYQWQNKLAGRSNLSYTTENFEVGVNMGFIRQKTHTSGGEQAMTFQLMWGSPLKLDGPSRGFFRNSHEDYHEYVSGEEEVDRFTGGFYFRHSPFEWLTHRLDVGGDFGNQRSFSLWPRTAQQPGPFRRSIGQKDVVQDRTTLTTINYSATVPFSLSEDITLETSSGVQYYQRKHQITTASGVEFPVPGVSTVSAAAQRLADESFIENKTFGVYVQEQIGWRNRLFLTGAVRGDDNSAFGENFDFVVYPKVSAAWVASEEPFWSVPFVNTLKLRAAWGRAGQQPDVFAATRLYEPATGRGGIPTLTPSNIGNPDLQPEVGQELELGFDASLLDQKLTIDFTYYDQTRRDAIVPAAALPSMGFPGTQFVNVGEVSNKGFEVALGTQVLRSEDWGLDLGASYATTDNKVVDLGGITPPLIGLPWPGQRHVEGYPVASMFMKKVVNAEWDASGNLVNMMCEGGDPISGGGPPVPCAEAGTAYWGSPTPTWDVAATANLRFRQWTLSATADGQGGYYKCNGDIAWANVFFRNTHEINLPPGQQDPILAAYDQMGFVCQAGAVDSGFAKLRDITLRWDLPSNLASYLGAVRATAQLSAHNMFVLWQATRELYGTRVIDPEVHSNTNFRGDIGDKGAYVQDLWPQLQRIDFTIRAVF
ncbi:MAG: SusC/RagA family TonB-linked outer membrane protein [Gemmatimonadota bacterium]|nr:SusC/RagA family TonB-linked outer membrane protein [Gemmatimonadota bacterium]MDE2864932.1 SusC/RagA family TonB-linked outer membrane protein [Gemmatimonadota bacterium]MYB05218.1 SusC/RagA family TonB-linked outer membrane protein [Gemmatimonadota bacterium]MYE15295.1 SusC/RagA family TonB-linked outer membrane protein [Gemmatimonadota bacterium]MYG23450.1 SusC/RagA family TonB-linked outer membrane protein [Gemmatimonadota bacterium]